MLDCVVELSTKTPIYAAIAGGCLPSHCPMHASQQDYCAACLPVSPGSSARSAGLLNEDKPEFVASLVELAGERFNAALAAADRHTARLLLRFLAALVVANVLHASSVAAALTGLVEAATSIAGAGTRRCVPCTHACELPAPTDKACCHAG